MIEEWQALTFESELIIMLGPQWAALAAGFAIVINGNAYLTPAGERYLARTEP
jgi:hypothetical protein